MPGVPTLAVVSEILPGLHLGCEPSDYRGYDVVINCQWDVRDDLRRFRGTMFIHLPMRDEDDFPLARIKTEIHAAAWAAVLTHGAGKRVLVHCAAGLNRSAVVMGEILALKGYERKTAVAIMRARRDSFVLCNRQFERWVLREPLPTAETSIFRAE